MAYTYPHVEICTHLFSTHNRFLLKTGNRKGEQSKKTGRFACRQAGSASAPCSGLL